MRRLLATLAVPLLLACSSSSSEGEPDAAVAAPDTGAGGSGGGGGGGQPDAAGGGGPDAAIDASIDVGGDVVMDVAVDPFADAPARPIATDPLSVVLFGHVDGIDVTGTYDLGEDAGGPADVCGPGFEVERTNEIGTTVAIRWSDMVNANPPPDTYDQFDAFDFTISRFMRVDGALRQITIRAGQVTTDSELLGTVHSEDLDATGTIDAEFHITKAGVVGLSGDPDASTTISDGDLFLWVAGTCK